MLRKSGGGNTGAYGGDDESFFQHAKEAFKDPFGLGGKITGPGGYKHVPYYFARVLPIIAEEKLLPQIDPDGKLTDEQKEEFVKDFVGSFIKQEGERWYWAFDPSFDLLHKLPREIEMSDLHGPEGETYDQEAERLKSKYTKPEIIEHTYNLLKRLYPNKMDPKGFKGKAARFLGKLGISENKTKRNNSTNNKMLKKAIMEELQLILQEDFGAGSNQNYEAYRVPSEQVKNAINKLKPAYEKLKVPYSACTGRRMGVKDAANLIAEAIKILDPTYSLPPPPDLSMHLLPADSTDKR
jgi:hypothetical protein